MLFCRHSACVTGLYDALFQWLCVVDEAESSTTVGVQLQIFTAKLPTDARGEIVECWSSMNACIWTRRVHGFRTELNIGRKIDSPKWVNVRQWSISFSCDSVFRRLSSYVQIHQSELVERTRTQVRREAVERCRTADMFEPFRVIGVSQYCDVHVICDAVSGFDIEAERFLRGYATNSIVNATMYSEPAICLRMASRLEKLHATGFAASRGS